MTTTWVTPDTGTTNEVLTTGMWNGRRDNLNHLKEGLDVTMTCATALSEGDVVVQSLVANQTVLPTTSAGDARRVFVAMATITASGAGFCRSQGPARVQVTGTVVVGDSLQTSTAAKVAQVGTTNAFAIALAAQASGTGLIPCLLVGASAGAFTSPLTTTGDLIYSSSGTTAARRAIGSTGDVLTVAGGVPTWAAPASSFVSPLTATGDLIYSSSGSTAARRAIGSSGDVLTVSGGLPTWAAPVTGFTSPLTTTGDLIYSSSGTTAARRGIGSSGEILTVSGGLPVWAAPATGTGDLSNGGNATGATIAAGTTDAQALWLRTGVGTSANQARLAITAGGLVGIGTTNTSPLGVLDVMPGQIALQYSGGGNGFRHWIDTVHAAGTATGNRLRFWLNNGASAGTSTAPNTGNQLSVVFEGKFGGSLGLGGIADPSAPLGFAAATGAKISLYDNGGGTYGFGIQSNQLQVYTNNSGDRTSIGYGTSGSFTELFAFEGNGNVGLNGRSYGSGVGAVFLANATTAPTTNPSGGGLLYCVAGALTYRGSSGTVTTLGVA